MILYHCTQSNLGDSFKSKQRTCTSPTIEQAMLGLLDLCRPKKKIGRRYVLGRASGKPLRVYYCEVNRSKRATEYDSHLTDERIVRHNTIFKLIATIPYSTCVYLQYFTYALSEFQKYNARHEFENLFKLLSKFIAYYLKSKKKIKYVS